LNIFYFRRLFNVATVFPTNLKMHPPQNLEDKIQVYTYLLIWYVSVEKRISKSTAVKDSVLDPDPRSAFLTLDPGWVKNQDPDPGSGIRDEQPGSYF
jgi:hypothetical protein